MRKWVLENSQAVYTSDYLSVFNDLVRIPDGSTIEYKRVQLKDFCSVLPITKEGKIVIIEIWRYPANRFSLEIPSGHVEQRETPRESAYRELEEETGYKATRMTSLGWFHPWTRSTQKAYLFFAEELTEGKQKKEPTEQIRVKLISTEEVREKLETGKITHAPTIIALQKLLLTRKKR